MKKILLGLLILLFSSFAFSKTFVKVIPFNPALTSEFEFEGKIVSIQVVESALGKDHTYLVVTYTTDTEDIIIPTVDTIAHHGE